MLLYTLKRIVYVTPVALGVSIFCFLLVHLAPGDPLTAVMPVDATAAQQAEMRAAYGFDKPLPVQYGIWLWKVLHGDLGQSDRHRPSGAERGRPRGRQFADPRLGRDPDRLHLRHVLRLRRRLFPRQPARQGRLLVSVLGVSVPHYWLGMVMVIMFSAHARLAAADRRGPGRSGNWRPDFEHLRYIILPAITMSVIPMGIISRTVRALVADILAQEFVQALRAKGLSEWGVFKHVVTNAAPTALAVMGLQLGYLLGGSILIETVFAWPGTGFLLNAAIFQRDLPLLQGTILVLAMFFVGLNLLVDVLQTALDPRIQRG